MTVQPRPAPSERRAATPLPWLLRRVNRRYRAATIARLEAAGFGDLPRAGYWALAALAGGPGEAGQLMADLGISKQAVSKLVDALVTTGFVDRTPNPADRRRSDLTLTTRGAAAVAVVEAATRDTDAGFVAELGPRSFAELGLLLERLARAEEP